LSNGTIEFIGRADFQVKVRGFRIELEEIEAQLRAYPGVTDAVAVAQEQAAEDMRLVAYYTADAGAPIDPEDLRRHLLARLPEYMVPSVYVALAALPLTPNGKLNRAALPAPGDDAYVTSLYEAPVDDIERRLAEIWADILGLQRVGRRDNFFELGGHSLLAIGVIDRLRQSGLHADVRMLFATPTLAELASTVRQPLEIAL
jgi:aryl carrier-like protein